MANRTPVLVVGAGPVGLAMAALLHRQDVSFRIVEKDAAPTTQSRALVIWPRTLELLRGCGLAEPLIAAGLKGTAAQVFSGAKRIVRLPLDRADSLYPFALFLPQSETERVIEAHLRANGVTVERQTELADFAPAADGVTAHLKRADGGAEELRADRLIACDGAHSTIRHKLALPFSGVTETSQFLLADIVVTGPSPLPLEPMMFLHPEGIMALFPIGPSHFRLIAFLGEFDADRPEPTLTQVQELLDRRGPGGLIASDPVWLSYFRINERKLKDYRAGCIFFAGDAAHVHSPAGGQGMNTGIQDACNLAWKLAMVVTGQAREMLLDSYSRERSAVGERVLHNAGALTRVATLRNPLLRGLRNLVIGTVGQAAFLQESFVRAMTELDIAYPESPLSRQAGPGAGGTLRPGDRAPDRLLVGPAGERVALYDLLSDRRFTLLTLAERGSADAAARGTWQSLAARFESHLAIIPIETRPAPARPEDAPEYRDATGRIAQDYGANGLVLVRPDLHIALTAGRGDWPAVETYLAALMR